MLQCEVFEKGSLSSPLFGALDLRRIDPNGKLCAIERLPALLGDQ
jgi:hypothetical protein